jgi:hypothetical protein
MAIETGHFIKMGNTRYKKKIKGPMYKRFEIVVIKRTGNLGKVIYRYTTVASSNRRQVGKVKYSIEVQGKSGTIELHPRAIIKYKPK